MNKITQDMPFRQSLLKYASKYGVTEAAIRYKTNCQYMVGLIGKGNNLIVDMTVACFVAVSQAK